MQVHPPPLSCPVIKVPFFVILRVGSAKSALLVGSLSSSCYETIVAELRESTVAQNYPVIVLSRQACI